MPDDLDNLKKRIGDSLPPSPDDEKESREFKSRSAGMQAGSEFTASIFAGGLLGWLAGHFFGNMALWLIVMLGAGFGLGIRRAWLASNKNDP